MKKFTATASGIALSTLLYGCATPHVVESVKTTDTSLTCSQIETEMKETDRFRVDAQKEKGMTGTNVAAVLFFWPAMIGTYSNANEAIAAADTRKAHLMGLYKNKKCDELAATKSQDEKALAEKTPLNSPPPTEKKLQDLKDMLDKKLITQEEYDEKRKAILAQL